MKIPRLLSHVLCIIVSNNLISVLPKKCHTPHTKDTHVPHSIQYDPLCCLHRVLLTTQYDPLGLESRVLIHTARDYVCKGRIALRFLYIQCELIFKGSQVVFRPNVQRSLLVPHPCVRMGRIDFQCLLNCHRRRHCGINWIHQTNPLTW